VLARAPMGWLPVTSFAKATKGLELAKRELMPKKLLFAIAGAALLLTGPVAWVEALAGRSA
jgi:hypothetical protein